jgi:hypothetical protein
MFEPFDEKLYLELFPDIAKAVEQGNFSSAWDHFCLYGYYEIIKRHRIWKVSVISLELKQTLQYLKSKKIPKNIKPIKNFQLKSCFSEQDWKMINSDNKLQNILKLYANSVLPYNIYCGISKFHVDYEPFNEEKYLHIHQDILQCVRDGIFLNAYEHFINYGYEEIIKGVRYWIKSEKRNEIEVLRLINLKHMEGKL